MSPSAASMSDFIYLLALNWLNSSRFGANKNPLVSLNVEKERYNLKQKHLNTQNTVIGFAVKSQNLTET